MDITVVIPVFNEEDFIGGCLEAILSTLKNSGLIHQVIVVDNGSSDGTSKILSGFKGIECFRIERATVAYARNYGAEKAAGNFLAFIDGDVIVTQEWGDAMRSLVERGDQNILTGFQCQSRIEGSWIERYWFSNIKSSHINSGNLVISRSAFNFLRGFDASLKTGEDVDICERSRLSDEVVLEKNEKFLAIHLDYPRTLRRFFWRELWHGEGDSKNLSFFLRSKVALLSSIYGVVSVGSLILLMFGKFQEAIVALFLLIIFNFLVTVYRFFHKSISEVMFCTPLNFIYFFARFLSIFTAIYKRNKKF